MEKKNLDRLRKMERDLNTHAGILMFGNKGGAIAGKRSEEARALLKEASSILSSIIAEEENKCPECGGPR